MPRMAGAAWDGRNGRRAPAHVAEGVACARRMWYNLSTWRMRAKAKGEPGGADATPLTGLGQRRKAGFVNVV